jgi:very-short-patch-repair endonuclease
MIHTALASGRLIRVRRGVFLAATAWPDDPSAQHIVLAHAEEVANPDAVISHESAGVCWGLPSPTTAHWRDQPVAVTYPHGGPYKSRRTSAVSHIGPLDPSDVTRDDDGYAVTTVARTAVDLAVGRSLPDALVILDAAARKILGSYVGQPHRRDFLNPTLVESSLEALSAVATRRARRLEAVIPLVVPARESAAESLTAGHLHLAGLPIPSFQAPIRTRLGTVYPDCYWREARLIGECDGAEKGSNPTAYVREKEREQVLRDEDLRFVRWLGKEIMFRPAIVMGRIERALTA